MALTVARHDPGDSVGAGDGRGAAERSRHHALPVRANLFDQLVHRLAHENHLAADEAQGRIRRGFCRVNVVRIDDHDLLIEPCELDHAGGPFSKARARRERHGTGAGTSIADEEPAS